MKQPYFIGITGGSGSGKTSFIEALKSPFEPHEICVISLDNYYHKREDQKIDENGIRNFDLPKSIDKKAFYADLKKLAANEIVRRPEYVFNNKLATPRMLEFCPAPIVIVEGLFVFHYKKVRKMLDLKVYLHAKENLKVIRRIKRDQIERNYPLDDVLYRYQHHVLPTFEKYIKPYVEDADIVINNNHAFEKGLEVLRGFIESKIRRVGE